MAELKALAVPAGPDETVLGADTTVRPPDPEEKKLIPITAERRWNSDSTPGTSTTGFRQVSGKPVACLGIVLIR